MWIIDIIKKNILALLFPLRCGVCGVPNTAICYSCLLSLKRAVETPRPYIYSHFSYKDTRVRGLLQKIKYFRKLYLIPPLVAFISKDAFLTNFIENNKNYLLVPIPMSRKRAWLRGGNHTKYITDAFSKSLNIPTETNLLLRKKDTIQQVLTHSRKERIKNMQKAFMCNEEYIKELQDKTIILIDDVTTTGATIAEAKKILENKGFRNIKAITLAH